MHPVRCSSYASHTCPLSLKSCPCVFLASSSFPWPTPTTGRASLVPWWRFAPTVRTARRRGLWSWLHRKGPRKPKWREPDTWCAFTVSVACASHSVLFRFSTFTFLSGPNKASAFIVFLHLLSRRCKLLLICPSPFIQWLQVIVSGSRIALWRYVYCNDALHYCKKNEKIKKRSRVHRLVM